MNVAEFTVEAFDRDCKRKAPIYTFITIDLARAHAEALSLVQYGWIASVRVSRRIGQCASE